MVVSRRGDGECGAGEWRAVPGGGRARGGRARGRAARGGRAGTGRLRTRGLASLAALDGGTTCFFARLLLVLEQRSTRNEGRPALK